MKDMKQLINKWGESMLLSLLMALWTIGLLCHIC